MAFRTDAASEGLYHDANAPQGAAWTMFTRFRKRGSGGTSGEMLSVMYDSGYVDSYTIYINSGQVEVTNNNSGYIQHSASITTDVWYDLALTNAGSGAGQLVCYWGPTNGAWASLSTTGTTITAAVHLYHAFQNADYFPNVDQDEIRWWTATLTADELARERATRRVHRTADLHRWLPMLYQTMALNDDDRSGNGYTLPVVGSPAVVDGAPVGWGAPIIVPQYAVASTAPVLSLPGVQDITATSARPKVTLTFS